MAKFTNLETQRPKQVMTTTDLSVIGHEGAYSWQLEPTAELFSRLVTGFVEDKFYESASTQLTEIRALVQAAIDADPADLVEMIHWCRAEGNMRSAPIAAACEYANYKGPYARTLVNRVCVRADEPAELLGYWLGMFGRPIPSSVKRGLSDAVVRLYTERNALRWDSSRSGVRMGDVIELCHPKPKDEAQAELFIWLIEQRHNRKLQTALTETLPTIRRRSDLMSIPQGMRHKVTGDDLILAGFSWESYSSYINGPMDATAWEKMIPSMGYMALLRNLRNFEEADISNETVNYVIAKLIDPQEIARSRQLPFRFWSAMKAVNTHLFSRTLEVAVEHVFDNVPVIHGNTLILLDKSASMTFTPVSKMSDMFPAEIGSVFAAALANSCVGYDLVGFATSSTRIDIGGRSIMKAIEIANTPINIGGGTDAWSALARSYSSKYDRVIVLTDMQFNTRGMPELDVPIYIWDLQGYGRVPVKVDDGNYMFTGISDKAFNMIRYVEDNARGVKPWQS